MPPEFDEHLHALLQDAAQEIPAHASVLPALRQMLGAMPLQRRSIMFRLQRYVVPVIAALLVVAIGVTFMIFGRPSSHHTILADPTATEPPTATVVSTFTPSPIPTETATPVPIAPGKLSLTPIPQPYFGYQACTTNDMSPEFELRIDLMNTGGRPVYWEVTSSDVTNPITNMTGSIEPGGTGYISFQGQARDYTVHIAWSDHVSASGNVTAMFTCQLPPAP